ncbi:hypothetical protein JHL17_18800 [Azospirillum sp. YIM B02556]|uniref:DUF5666 domain-containing protein n=1 Tax=Azospirillum endophyticum TaxID=2800326 RepID=A0ABS1F7W9_9PROT|nr:hypothetical protein [Azospirillum endophyticum]MBK1839463.1 hypothetical protein [Azospirillum endophyticum]
MTAMTRRTVAALFSTLAITAGVIMAGAATAQTMPPSGAEPVRLRGTIESVAGDALDLTTRSGGAVHVQVPAGTRLTYIVKNSLESIQPGSYIGTAAVPQADGTLRALEVHIFPPGMRGTGEGSRPWDLGGEGGSMTNGTVGSLVSASGRVATVKYGNDEKRILIPDDVPVVAFEPADKAALTAGAKVIVVGRPVAESAVVASSISIGKDGLTPPM